MKDPVADALEKLAQSLFSARDYAGAAEALRKLLGLRPDDPDILANLGGALVKLERYGEASGVLNRALAQRPDKIQTLANAALAEKSLAQPYAQHLVRILQAPAQKPRDVLSKIWAALLLDLPEKAFALKIDGLNILDYDKLGRLYASGHWPEKIQTLPKIHGTWPRRAQRPVIYAAASGDYAATFAHDLIQSALAHAPTCDVHLHVMNPGAYDPAENLGAFPQDRVTWTWEDVGPHNKVVFSTRRFVRLAQFLAQADRLLVALDADAVVNGDIAAGLAKMGAFDVAIYNRPDEPYVNQMVSAGLFAVAPTAGGRAFADLVAAYILYFEERGEACWFLDQLAIVAAKTWFQKNVPAALVQTIATEFMDWSGNYSPHSLMWTLKGGKERSAWGVGNGSDSRTGA